MWKGWIVIMKIFALLVGIMLMFNCALPVLAEAEQTPAPEATEDVLAQPSSTTLMAYFSCTGNTEAVAQLIAEALSADVYRIEPEVPYASEDLNYNDDNSRANQEMNDPDCRPAIAGEPLTFMDSYQTIYLGYPIWWGEAPRIISTFLESYDLNGKTIVPFCTSGGSGFGQSGELLSELTADDVNWVEGKRFSASATADDIAQWLDEMGVLPVDAQ